MSFHSTLIAATGPGPAKAIGTTKGSVPLGLIEPATDSYSKGSETAAGAVSNLELFISNVIGLITIAGSIFFLIQCFLGAIDWIQSDNDKGKKEKAQGRFTGGAFGLIIMVGIYSVAGWLGPVIGIDILNPGAQLLKLIPHP